MLRIALPLILILSLCNSCSLKKEPPSKMALIFDADVDVNDLYTLYLLSRSPQVQLMGVTISGAHNYYFDQAGSHVESVLDLAHKNAIPVSSLPSTTFCSSPLNPAWINLGDDFSKYHLPVSSNKPLNTTGTELMRHLLEASSEKVSILCCGPLNNVANLITTYPQLLSKIEKIVVLAGSLHTLETLTLPRDPYW